MMLLLLAPIYAGSYVGLWLLYGDEVRHSALQIDYQWQSYEGLWNYWEQHQATLSWFDFMLPSFGPLVFGIVSGFAFLYLFLRYLRGIFIV